VGLGAVPVVFVHDGDDDMAMGMENPLKAALRNDVQLVKGKGWHNLTWRQ